MSIFEVYQNMSHIDIDRLSDARIEETSILDSMSDNVRIAVVIPEALKQRLEFLCGQEHRSLSGQVHMWIAQKVAEWEAQHPEQIQQSDPGRQ